MLHALTFPTTNALKIEYPLSLLCSMGVGKLKRCMADAGVFFDPLGVVEKEDMIHIVRRKGKKNASWVMTSLEKT